MPPSLRRFVVRLCLVSSFFVLAAVSSEASDGTSDPIPPPARRWDAAAAYDPIGNQLMVFGGVVGDAYPTNDSWGRGLSGGGVWTPKLQAEPFPSARSGATLTYDSLRKRLILFGGQGYDPNGDAVYLNDVWIGSPSGAGWTQLTVSGTPPSSRYGHVALYDPSGDRLIICGGSNDVTDLGDVWELKFAPNATWNEIHTPQSLIRTRAAAVIDPLGSRLILFGGTVGSTTNNDTWALSLSGPVKWTSLGPTGTPPPVREGHTAVFDSVNRRMIIFGGAASPYVNRKNDTWSLNLAGSPQWVQLSPSGTLPMGRAYHNAVWDPSNSRMIVFGGYLAASPFNGNDLWALDPSTGWSQLPDLPNPGRFMSSASFYDPVRDRLVVFGGTDGTTYSNALWAHPPTSNASWTAISTTGGPPSPRSGASLIYDADHDRAILFGGNDDAVVNNDVWLLDLASNTWSPTTPSGFLPPPRSFHSAIYDSPRNRMLIFGGGNGRNDTWEFVLSDPAVWNQLLPSGTPPSPRMGQSAISDPARDRMLVFSGGIPGFDGGVYKNDIWALSLSGAPAWTQITPSGTPPIGRVTHSAFYDPTQDRMMIFGGGQVLGTFYGYMFNDVWELSLSGTPTWNELHPSGVLPPQRARHGWGYDSVNNRLVVFGGFVITYGATDDAWIFHFGPGTTSVELPSQSVALRFVASPNPVLTRTNMKFHLDTRGPVTLSVHDVQGRRVAILEDRVLDPGDHEIIWEPNRESLGSGVYFYDLVAGKARSSGRLVLLK